MARKQGGADFERSLRELEKLVERLEDGELTLEESLKTYERGVELSRRCQHALEAAEERVRILTENDVAAPVAEDSAALPGDDDEDDDDEA
ncbi:MAG: exodeoxyribonuclease VII small subunit [Ectothiorhodospiraceae bacterium]|nr:exodeoxyribonuclease VII small subunit [Ectothiorhodospiraceae bacterium]